MKRRPPLPKQGQIITVDYLNKLGACDIPDWLIREFPSITRKGLVLNRKNLYRAARAADRAREEICLSLGWVLLNRMNAHEEAPPSREYRSLWRRANDASPHAQAKMIADILDLDRRIP